MQMFKNNLLIIIFAAVFALIVMPVSIFYYLIQPVNKTQEELVRFVVPKNQAVVVIAHRLEDASLIRSSMAFRIFVKLNNLDGLIQAGSFDLSPSMSTNEIVKNLTTGTEDVWITIIEGWRMEEIAESLESQSLDSFDKEEFMILAADSEGMLFPDTYLIPREMSPENIHSLLLNTFERKVTQGLAQEISTSKRDFDDVLIMASIVEREARNYNQMRRVAGILWNRIDKGIALQVDATLQYAAGYNKLQKTWWAPPTAQQKQINSKFNTYLFPGLPPHAISNPGLDAIKASLLPLETDDLYYIHANDGNIYTAQTLEEHNANINKYLR
jgi:UPF0755 protein